MAHYSSGEAGCLVLEHFPFTNAASQWLYVNLVCRFHTRLGRFSPGTPVPPTPKNRNPFIFLVNSFWSLVCIKSACLPEVWLLMCALRLSHSGALRTLWVDMSRVTKTANYYYYYYLDLDFTTATQPIRARSQIPVLGLTGYALGLPDSLKLPGASTV